MSKALRELGTLKTVDLRTIWKKEDRDFTPWLLENSDRLAEALGIDIELHEAEHSVGTFSLDLLGKLPEQTKSSSSRINSNSLTTHTLVKS